MKSMCKSAMMAIFSPKIPCRTRAHLDMISLVQMTQTTLPGPFCWTSSLLDVELENSLVSLHVPMMAHSACAKKVTLFHHMTNAPSVLSKKVTAMTSDLLLPSSNQTTGVLILPVPISLQHPSTAAPFPTHV